MKSIRKIKIAFVHDDFIQFGGAEKLFLDVIKDFSADNLFEIKIFSSLISPEWAQVFNENGFLFEESFLNKIPYCYKIYKFFFIFNLFYLAFYEFDFSDFDVVISSSTRFGHGIITKPSTFHISYINSPSRGLWEENKYFYGKKFLYLIIKNFLPKKRVYDLYTQHNSDLIISNSLNIKNKVKKIYRRNSIVLYPFVPKQKPNLCSKKEDIYLLVSRLVSWKRLDFVINTFNLNGKNLVVIGTGPEFYNYTKMANKNIVFLGYVNDFEKIEYFKRAKFFIFPQNEDFGITLLEAINYDCVPIYYKKGGATEILKNHLGIGFQSQTIESLQGAINQAQSLVPNKLVKERILNQFDKDYFLKFLKRIIFAKFKI